MGSTAESELPLGLLQLKKLDKVLVGQESKVFAKSKFRVFTPQEDELLLAVEEGSKWRQHIPIGRPFNMYMEDMDKNKVIQIQRPYKFRSNKIEVTVNGEMACIVREIKTFLTILVINDAEDQPVLRVKGSKNICNITDFEIQSLPEKKRIGVITKPGTMLSKLFTHDEHFEITFPHDLDVRHKAAVIATCILIDSMYYM